MSVQALNADEAAHKLFAGLLRDGYMLNRLHVYDGEDGLPLYYRARLTHLKKEKAIRPFRRTDDGWVIGEPNLSPKPLYRLSRLAKQRQQEPVVVIVEGEKAADALHEWAVAVGARIVAITSGASSSAGGADWRPLAGLPCLVWPDNDPQGAGYADAVMSALRGVAATVERVDVEALGLPPKGDAVEWLESTPDAQSDAIAKLPRITARAEIAVSAGTGWQAPQSLERTVATGEPYPLDVMPGLIRAAVDEYQPYGQQPLPLVASSALAVVSLAAQGLYDVARDEQLRGPLSLNFMTIGQSGERKTAADRAFSWVLAEWESQKAEILQDDIAQSRAAMAAWKAEGEGIEAALRKSAGKQTDDVGELRQKLAQHERDEPKQLVAPRLRYENVNPQALPYHMAKGHPSAALWSDEGGMVTGSQGMGSDSLVGFMSVMNRLWDGGAIHQDRKMAESVHLEGRRLTVSLMVQPSVLRDLNQRSGGLTRGSGFLARYLIAAPASTMGTRRYRDPPTGMPCLGSFQRRIRELLDAPFPVDGQGRLSPPVLSLSTEAKRAWRDYHDEIELQLVPAGALREVPDFAAKSAENAARIAACLHVFEGEQGAISARTMRAGVTLARWYLRECLRVLDQLDEPQEWANARKLDAWLIGQGDCSTREAQQRGPIRNKVQLAAALEVLADLDRVVVENEGKRRNIRVNPALRGVATATDATVATDIGGWESPVASVATVAVANAVSEAFEV